MPNYYGSGEMVQWSRTFAECRLSTSTVLCAWFKLYHRVVLLSQFTREGTVVNLGKVKSRWSKAVVQAHVVRTLTCCCRALPTSVFLFFPFSSQQFLLSVLTVWTSHPTRAMSNWRKSCCLPLKKQKDLDKSNCWDPKPPEDRDSSAVPVPSFSACCTSYCKLGLWLESYLSVSRLMLLGFTFQ